MQQGVVEIVYIFATFFHDQLPSSQSDGGSLYDGFENLWENDEVTQAKTAPDNSNNNKQQRPSQTQQQQSYGSGQNRPKQQQPNFYSQLNAGSEAGEDDGDNNDFGLKKMKDGKRGNSIVRNQSGRNGGDADRSQKKKDASVLETWSKVNNLIAVQKQKANKPKANVDQNGGSKQYAVDQTAR
jgi:hypothetical protein